MNQKKEPLSQTNFLIAGIVAVILVAAGIGYLVGKKGQTSAPETRQTSPGEAQAPTPASPAPAPATPLLTPISTPHNPQAEEMLV